MTEAISILVQVVIPDRNIEPFPLKDIVRHHADDVIDDQAIIQAALRHVDLPNINASTMVVDHAESGNLLIREQVPYG